MDLKRSESGPGDQENLTVLITFGNQSALSSATLSPQDMPKLRLAEAKKVRGDEPRTNVTTVPSVSPP